MGSFSLPQVLPLQREEEVTRKVFARWTSWLGFLPPVVWKEQNVNAFFLLSYGLVWVCFCPSHQHGSHHRWYRPAPAHPGEARVAHAPAAGVASTTHTTPMPKPRPHRPQCTTGLLLTMAKWYLQATYADPTIPVCSWREIQLQPQSQYQCCLNLTRALLSATVTSYHHSCTRASYAVSCFSLLLRALSTA